MGIFYMQLVDMMGRFELFWKFLGNLRTLFADIFFFFGLFFDTSFYFYCLKIRKKVYRKSFTFIKKIFLFCRIISTQWKYTTQPKINGNLVHQWHLMKGFIKKFFIIKFLINKINQKTNFKMFPSQRVRTLDLYFLPISHLTTMLKIGFFDLKIRKKFLSLNLDKFY